MAMTTTALQAIRGAYPSFLDRHELRPEIYGLLKLAIANATNPMGIISPDILAQARTSWGRATEIPVMSPSSSANGTGLTCTFSGTEAISDLIGITYVSISNGYDMEPAKNFQNEISYLQENARKYTDMIRKIAAAVDASVDTALTANITPEAEYASSYVGAGERYPFIANVMQVALANRPNFFNDATDIMAADNLLPTFDVVGSTNLRSIVSQLFAQGEANSQNTEYQFTKGDFDFLFSNNLTATPVTADASGIIMPKGAIAILNRNSPDCLAGNIAGGDKRFGTLFDPTLGMTMDTLDYSECGSIATKTGNVQDTTAVIERHQVAIHYAILTPYSNFASSGVSSVIRKFDLKKV